MPRILRKLTIGEISAVDRPAQTHARSVIMKRAGDDDNADIVALAKGLVVDNISHGVAAADFTAELTKRATAAFPNLSASQAFTKYADALEDGKMLFRAILKAERTVAQAAQDFPTPKAFGPASRQLNEIAFAIARRKAISLQDAHGLVATDPAHADLVRRSKEEAKRVTDMVRNQREPIRAAERALSR